MTSPVRLSRERWEMLRDALTSGPPTMESIVNVAMANRMGQLTVYHPLETNGIVFLPAEYVPGDVVRPEKTITLAVGGAH